MRHLFIRILVWSLFAVAFAAESDYYSAENGHNEHFLFKTLKKRRLSASEVEKTPGITVKITEKLSQLLESDKFQKILAKRFEKQSFETLKFKALQMNVSVFDTKLVHLEWPSFKIEFKEPNSLVLTTSKGQAGFKGVYKGVYRTVRDGYAHVEMTGINLAAEFKFLRGSRELILSKMKFCGVKSDSTTVEMKPKLFSQADEIFVRLFEEAVQTQICNHLGNYGSLLGQVLTKSIRNSPVKLESLVDNIWKTEFVAEPKVEDQGLIFALNGQRGSSEVNSVEMHETDDNQMLYAYVSDSVFNAFLDQFKNKQIELDWPQPEQLRLSCPESNCIGTLIPSLANKYPGFQSKVAVSFKSAPKLEFSEIGAKLTLDFTGHFFLISKDEEKRIFSADFVVGAWIDKFMISAAMDSVEEDIGDDYKLLAKVRVESVDLVSTFTEEKDAVPFVENLPILLVENNHLIQKVVENNLHHLFPLQTNPFLSMDSIHGFFRRHTLVLAFDLALDERQLLRHLKLL